MTLSTLTETEQRWHRIAKRAVEQDETWEKCPECGRYHPASYEGDCSDESHRLPRRPKELLD